MIILKPRYHSCSFYYTTLGLTPKIEKHIYVIELKLLKRGWIRKVLLLNNYQRCGEFKSLCEFVDQKIRFVFIKSDIPIIPITNFKRSAIVLDNEAVIKKIGKSKNLFVTRKIYEKSEVNLVKKVSIFDHILIPYNDKVDNVCDYVEQTAKQASFRADVYLVKTRMAIWWPSVIFNMILRKNSSKPYNELILINLFPKNWEIKYRIYKINQWFKSIQLKVFLSGKRYLYWCFDPFDFDYLKHFTDKVVSIYDCVDYFSSQNKLWNEEIRTEETKLIKTVDYFFTNSYILSRLKSPIKKSTVVPQGFDEYGYDEKINPDLVTERFKEFDKKVKGFKMVVGFVGNLGYRFDFNILIPLIRKRKDILFAFTTAKHESGVEDLVSRTKENIAAVISEENVTMVGFLENRGYIKELIKRFDICMIPYNTDIDFVKYCYPMKLFEYFYVGRPVIATPIEELKRKEFSGLVLLGNSSEQWSKTIDRLTKTKFTADKIRKQRLLANQNSWENKLEKIYEIIYKK